MEKGSMDERVEKAKIHKSRGNEFVQRREFKSALVQYQHVFLQIRGIYDFGAAGTMAGLASAALSDVQKPSARNVQDAKELAFQTWSNMALCYLRTQRPARALQVANQALGDTPLGGTSLPEASKNKATLQKVYLRRSEARALTDDVPGAERDLAQVERLAAVQSAEAGTAVTNMPGMTGVAAADPGIQRVRELIAHCAKVQDQKDSRVYAKMFQ
eukprot:ANDGO_01236.mRNA.1 hypothetical protein PHYSODRAFT_347263